VLDWSSVPYPPWWHDRAAKRRTALDAAVNELRARSGEIPDLVGFLVFGSYATGRVGPESDLDVLAVTRDPDPSRSERYLRIVRRLDLGVPYDLIVYSAEEYEKLAATWPFVQQARAEGIWIDATTPR
jgi:predicted nucleotidyltransferase